MSLTTFAALMTECDVEVSAVVTRGPQADAPLPPGSLVEMAVPPPVPSVWLMKTSPWFAGPASGVEKEPSERTVIVALNRASVRRWMSMVSPAIGAARSKAPPAGTPNAVPVIWLGSASSNWMSRTNMKSTSDVGLPAPSSTVATSLSPPLTSGEVPAGTPSQQSPPPTWLMSTAPPPGIVLVAISVAPRRTSILTSRPFG